MIKETHETILTKLRNIQSLVSDPSSTEGERENGRQLYFNLLKKYGLKDSDLVEEKKEIVQFIFETEYEKKLLYQILYKVTGSENVSYWKVDPRTGRPHKNAQFFELSKLQHKEIELLYSVYLPELRKGLEKFAVAFIHSNRIFPENSDKGRNEKPMSMADLEELIRMMRNINPTIIPRNLLPKKFQIGEPA